VLPAARRNQGSSGLVLTAAQILIDSNSNALQRLIGMVRSPRATLTRVIARPRSLDLGIVIVVISAVCSAGFLLTEVGQLAALDQQVRQLESFGADVTDERYAQLRSWIPYRPAITAVIIVVGWPALWLAVAAIVKAAGDRACRPPPRGGHAPQTARRGPTFAQVLTVIVHASAIFALRSLIVAPLNYARESIGGATSLSVVMPAFGESTFPARLLGAVDLFMLWWVALAAMGLGMLYETRTVPIARWLLATYAAGAIVLALTQALRGGV
jgi:hypothetical protein